MSLPALSRRLVCAFCMYSMMSFWGTSSAALPDLIEQIKPSIVVIGTYSKTRSPAFVMRGTGFAVGNGTLVATNAHVVPEGLDPVSGEDPGDSGVAWQCQSAAACRENSGNRPTPRFGPIAY